MNIKSLLLGSAAALVAASGAQAADAIVAPEPEAVEYVRVCDAYGAGYFYIPGTETCLRIHGYVRYDVKGGDNVYSGTDRKGWDKGARFALRVSTGSETELGTLKTYTELRFNYAANNSREDGYYGTNSDGTVMQFAYIQLGGLRVGIDESEFQTFTGYLGDVINDDVISAGTYRTGKISYTFTGGNGFSAVIALEQGGDNDGGYTPVFRDSQGNEISGQGYQIDGYMPDVVGGLKYAGGWGSIAGVVAYDSVIEEWATKVRGDVNITDQFSVWLQGAYSSAATPDQNYGQWGGDWAVWGGLKYQATQKAAFNLQAAHDDWGKTAVTANVAYELVPGFTITPEVSYTKFSNEWKRELGNDTLDDAWGGIVRFQRSF
ncbi:MULTISPECIES: porin [Brucella]|uniref:Porin n=1 Tax=Brucella inopinata BO1 TaxID=470735 RepID=B5U6X9_9HYPH|nr:MULTISPECIES: porin [Brucella]KEY05953.1 porin [Brucella suis bv. 4 str. 40]EFM56208.1 outer membrane protein 2b [Brucella inopinata BO1]UWF67122.1 porin [Brucella sp. 1315]UWF70247.1 porin [Brucella sp. 2594]CAQ68392.1 outer membrane protein 2b [Brucella inopinata BO1]